MSASCCAATTAAPTSGQPTKRRVKKNTDPRRSRGMEIFLEAAARLPARSDLFEQVGGGANAEPQMSEESLGAPLAKCMRVWSNARGRRGRGSTSLACAWKPPEAKPTSMGARRRRRVGARSPQSGRSLGEQRRGAGPQAQGDPLRGRRGPKRRKPAAKDRLRVAATGGRGGVAEGSPPLEWVVPYGWLRFTNTNRDAPAVLS